MSKQKNRKRKAFILLSLLAIFIGSSIIFVKKVSNYLYIKEEKELIKEFYDNQKQIQELGDEKKSDKSTDNQSTIKTKNNYIAVLKIPKIGLEKGLCYKGEPCNNVDQNIKILEESNMPDQAHSNLILVAHSGNGRAAYFKNIHKLEVKDTISIFYKNSEYQYEVVNWYEIEKTGVAEIVRNSEKNTLTLITCIHNTNKQVIYICEHIKAEEK